jgi:hypothetical protein
MQIEFIYTYVDGEQGIRRLDTGSSFPKTKRQLSDIAKEGMPEELKECLIKVSCCLYSDDVTPKWYDKCNGKLWYEQGVLQK